MIVLTLARKPLGGETVAITALKYGTGGLNIDGARIGTADNLNGGAYSGGVRPLSAMGCTGEVGGTGSMLEAGGGRLNPEAFQQPTGRWPANLILMHQPGCRCVGTRTVLSDGHHPATRGRGSLVAGSSGHPGQDGLQERSGPEVTDSWDCAPGCPVAALDEQSGERPNSFRTSRGHQGGFFGWKAGNGPGFRDTGGASRFFKQVRGEEGKG